MDRIYLDYAATTPMDEEALTEMLPYFKERYGNPDSPHATGRGAQNAVDGARDTLAALLNAKPSEIYFTSGGTEADNWGLQGAAYAQKEKGRTHILLSSIEHHALLSCAKKLEREGFSVTLLPVNEGGMVETNALKAALRPDTGVVAVMAVNNETGVVQPIRELAQIARENGSLFLCDGVQAAPHQRIDVKALGVDMLTLSAHKFYGPKGCGALYIKSGVKMRGLIVGGEQERGLRGGTTNVPAVVGMATAYRRLVESLEGEQKKLSELRALFLGELADLDGVTVNGEGLPSLLNLRFAGVSNVDFVYAMDLKGVSVAAGAACASASIKPSHVLLAMGLTEAQAKECVRFSFGKQTTTEEVLKAAKLTKEVVRRLAGEE